MACVGLSLRLSVAGRVVAARRRRDEILELLSRAEDLQISLRFSPRAGGRAA